MRQVHRGATFIELLAVVATGAILIVALTALVGRSIHVDRNQFAQVRTTEDARLELQRTSDALRNSQDLTSGPQVKGFLQQGEDFTLQVYTNVDSDQEPELVRYFVDPKDPHTINRGIIDPNPGGNYPPGQEVVTALTHSLQNTAQQPLFTYYDAQGTVLKTPLSEKDKSNVTSIGLQWIIDADPNADPGPVTENTRVAIRGRELALATASALPGGSPTPVPSPTLAPIIDLNCTPSSRSMDCTFTDPNPIPTPTPPAPPTSPAPEQEDGFKVHDGGGGKPTPPPVVQQLPANPGTGGKVTYTEDQLAPDTDYTRYVTSYNANGESAPSNSVTVHTQAEAPCTPPPVPTPVTSDTPTTTPGPTGAPSPSPVPTCIPVGLAVVHAYLYDAENNTLTDGSAAYNWFASPQGYDYTYEGGQPSDLHRIEVYGGTKYGVWLQINPEVWAASQYYSYTPTEDPTLRDECVYLTNKDSSDPDIPLEIQSNQYNTNLSLDFIVRVTPQDPYGWFADTYHYQGAHCKLFETNAGKLRPQNETVRLGQFILTNPNDGTQQDITAISYWNLKNATDTGQYTGWVSGNWQTGGYSYSYDVPAAQYQFLTSGAAIYSNPTVGTYEQGINTNSCNELTHFGFAGSTPLDIPIDPTKLVWSNDLILEATGPDWVNPGNNETGNTYFAGNCKLSQGPAFNGGGRTLLKSNNQVIPKLTLTSMVDNTQNPANDLTDKTFLSSFVEMEDYIYPPGSFETVASGIPANQKVSVPPGNSAAAAFGTEIRQSCLAGFGICLKTSYNIYCGYPTPIRIGQIQQDTSIKMTVTGYSGLFSGQYGNVTCTTSDANTGAQLGSGLGTIYLKQ